MERTEQAKEMWRKAFGNLVDDMKGLTREQLASGFFELGWRAADENPPKDTSLIKWQTGIPDERCAYIVTLQDGTVSFDYFGFWGDAPKVWQRYNEYSIKAWCKLSDVEPYKEE